MKVSLLASAATHRHSPQDRQVLEAIDTSGRGLTIWGDDVQSRSFMYIDDCVKGSDPAMHRDELIATLKRKQGKRVLE